MSISVPSTQPKVSLSLGGGESNAISLIQDNSNENKEESKLILDGKEANFSDHLWDQFDSVFSRLTKGRHDLKHIRNYMSERAEAEMKYATALKKASEIPDLEENYSLSNCWKDLKKSSLSFAKQHESLGVICNEIAGGLEKSILEIKALKTKLFKKNEEIISDREKKKSQWEKAKKDYAEKLKLLEAAITAKEGAKGNDKQYKKETMRVLSLVKESDSAHLLYKKSVEIYFESQKSYDTSIVDIMMQFERCERARLLLLSTQLQRFSQSMEFLRNAMDQIALFIAKGMMGINILKDLNDFIKDKYSAAKHPPYVQYEPIKSLIIERELKASGPSLAPQLLAAATSGSEVGIAVPQTGTYVSSSPIATNPAPPASTPALNLSAPAPPASPLTSPLSSSSAAPISPLPTSSSFQPHPPSSPPPSRAATAVALYDFNSDEGDDLPFKAGDMIVLLSSPEGEDWWQGEMKGKIGMFPKTYVEKKTDENNHTHDQSSAASTASSSTEPGTEGSSAAAAGGGEEHHKDGHGGGEAPRLMQATCIALYDFDGQDADELSFKAGQVLHITGELNGWYLGRVDGSTKIGIFPSNYIKIGQ